MSQQTEVTIVRLLPMPAALALADLAAVFEELQFVLKCCERLITELAGPRPDDVVLESVWISALNSYGRCFRPGDRGIGLTEADLTATNLQGDVLQWHKLLGELREFYLNGPANPRETFSVGAAQASAGEAVGIVITSANRERLNDVTVRQTGRLAFELSRVLDERITKQQETVLAAARALSAKELGALPLIDVVAPDQGQPAPGTSTSTAST
jgi:hypothetical protein